MRLIGWKKYEIFTDFNSVKSRTGSLCFDLSCFSHLYWVRAYKTGNPEQAGPGNRGLFITQDDSINLTSIYVIHFSRCIHTAAVALTYNVHFLAIKAALGERLSVFSTDRLHICFHWAAVLESALFVIFTWSRAAERPDCSRIFCWRLSVISPVFCRAPQSRMQ